MSVRWPVEIVKLDAGDLIVREEPAQPADRRPDRPSFICVGGPLDGQWWACLAPSFLVHQLAEPIAATCRADQGTELVETIQHCYALSEHEVHGTAWVYQP